MSNISSTYPSESWASHLKMGHDTLQEVQFQGRTIDLVPYEIQSKSNGEYIEYKIENNVYTFPLLPTETIASLQEKFAAYKQDKTLSLNTPIIMIGSVILFAVGTRIAKILAVSVLLLSGSKWLFSKETPPALPDAQNTDTHSEIVPAILKSAEK